MIPGSTLGMILGTVGEAGTDGMAIGLGTAIGMAGVLITGDGVGDGIAHGITRGHGMVATEVGMVADAITAAGAAPIMPRRATVNISAVLLMADAPLDVLL